MKKRLLSIMLAVLMVMGVVITAPISISAAIAEGENIALSATASAQYTNTYGNTPGRMNDGIMADATGSTSWNCWDFQSSARTVWVQYTWPSPMVIDSMEVLWWADGGGVKWPSSVATVEYFDGTDWVQITDMTNEDGAAASGVGTKQSGTNGANTTWNGVEFTPVTTDQIRMTMSLSSGNVGISEWRVYGETGSEELFSAAISGAETIVSGNSATYKASYKPASLTGATYSWAISSVDGEAQIVGATNESTVNLSAVSFGNVTLSLSVTHNGVTKTAEKNIFISRETNIGVGTNIAPNAKASADHENTPVSNVNNGSLATGAGTSWNTWNNSNGYPTPVTLTWDSPMEITSMQVMWWADLGGVQFPSNATLQYHDGTQWVNVTELVNEDGAEVSNVGVKFDGGTGANGANRYWNGVEFEPFTTDKLRMLISRNGAGATGVGIGEWQVFGTPDNSALWAAKINGPTVIGKTEEGVFTGSYTPAALEGAASYEWSLTTGSDEFIELLSADGNTARVKGIKTGTGTLSLTVTHETGVKTATFDVLVESPDSVDDYITATAAGKAPILPDRVVVNGLRFDTPSANYSRGGFSFYEEFNSKLMPVEWDEVNPEDYAADKVGTTFEVNGRVEYGGEYYPAKAIITVNEPAVVAVANTAVTFENIQLTDDFWLPKQEVNAVASLNKAIYQIAQPSGGEPNFINSIKKLNGEEYDPQQGFVFQDTDIYKTLEAISYTLSVINDSTDPEMIAQKANLEEVLDRWIGYIEDVQYADGYINTHFTLRASGNAGGGTPGYNRWRDFSNHEMYNAGHFFESAVAYTRYTEGIGEPDYRLYVVAKRFADEIVDLFGPNGSRNEIPGHEEVELALVKIANMVEEHEGEGSGQVYLDTAKHLIDMRGREKSTRESGYNGREYSQDNVAFVDADIAVGHSVRAAYLYSGAADIAAKLPDSDPDKAAYINTLDTINDRVVQRNTYITGGVGYEGGYEGFGEDYELPNTGSYCETCAGIAMAMWNQRMNLVHEDAKYIDSVEKVLYNNVLAGVNLEGNLFYYSSHLEVTNGNPRYDWFACACCPPNLMRTIASISGYMYSVHADDLFVNLYVGSDGNINVNGTSVNVKQETNYPWEGSVGITVTPDTAKEFTMNFRIPGWVNEQSNQDVTISVNGVETPVVVENGYVAITRTWNAGDIVQVNLPMEVRITEAHDKVKDNVGRVVIERGPLVYCVERAGNADLNDNASFNANAFIIPRDAEFTAEYNASLLNGVVEIRSDNVYVGDTSTPAKLQAVPYYAWNNRGNNGVQGQNNSTRMSVWINATGDVNKFDPVFTDSNGEVITELSDNQLNVSYSYRNNAYSDMSLDDPLMPLDYTMIVAVYDESGVLKYSAADSKYMSTLNQVGSFNVSLDLPENLADDNYYAKVFLWDSNSYVPIYENVLFGK